MSNQISIIVPIYNTEKYLERCLQSILNQSYRNIEIILVNDGSDDNSLAICNKYKDKEKRIIVIDKKHTGVADTRNIGLKKSSGNYIGFVDSDDYIDIDMFKKLIVGAEKYKCDISMCDLIETYNTNDEIKPYKLEYIQMDKRQALEQLLYDKNIGNYVMVKLFKRELFDGIQFPVGKLYEDISTTYKLFCKANNILYIPNPMYHYFQRSDSIVNNITRESIQHYIRAVFERYYDLKNTFKGADLYNVYSIVNVVVKMSIWAIRIQDYELFDNEIYNYYCKLEKELNLVDEGKLVTIMTDLEKACFYLLKLNKNYLKNFIENK